MSLLHCAECGHEISDNAVACPNCGRPTSVPAPVVERKVVVVDNSRDRDGFPTWAFIPIGMLAVILLILVYVLMNRNIEDNANLRVNVNTNTGRQTTTTVPSNPSQPSTVATVPSSGPSTVSAPPASQTSVPGSQTTVAESPTKGKVNIVAKVTARNGSTQVVRNEKFYLLDQDVETILSSAGVSPIEGQSLTGSLGLSLVFPDRYGEFNRNAFSIIRKHIKYSGQTDGAGKAQLGGIEPNGYYLFGMTRSGRGFTVWNSLVSVQVGDNFLNLAPQTLTEIQDPAG